MNPSLVGWSSVLRPRQHSTGYMGDGFTGQKTQLTVSNYWRKKLRRNSLVKQPFVASGQEWIYNSWGLQAWICLRYKYWMSIPWGWCSALS